MKTKDEIDCSKCSHNFSCEGFDYCPYLRIKYLENLCDEASGWIDSEWCETKDLHKRLTKAAKGKYFIKESK